MPQINKQDKKTLKNISKELDLEHSKKDDKRVKCIYCKKPIHIDRLAGITSKGMICGNSFCLMKLAKEWKKRENK